MITPQSFPAHGPIGSTGITYAAPLSADRVPLGSLLHVKNASASAITVTVSTAADVLETGGTYPPVVVSVPAAGDRVIPITLNAYLPGDGTTNASVSFSSITSVTVAAIANF